MAQFPVPILPVPKVLIPVGGRVSHEREPGGSPGLPRSGVQGTTAAMEHCSSGDKVMETTVLGYPRTGAQGELEKATEAFWAGHETRAHLTETAAALRRQTWETLRDAGLSEIPSNTFSLHDHVLDTAVMVNAVPERFAGLDGLGAYFAMARGAEGIAPLERAQWFDTSYHYLVPELGPGTDLRLAQCKPVLEYLQARSYGIETRPVLLGPLSFLLLSRPAAPGFRPLVLLDPLRDGYEQLLEKLHAAGGGWGQLDEP